MPPSSVENVLEKVPPQSRDAEAGVIGSMLFDEQALVKGIELLKPAYFYEENNRHIFEVLVALFEKNQPVDILTVSEELRRRNFFDVVGGSTYLTHLTSQVPTSAHIEHYAKIVKEKFLLRSLIDKSTRIVHDCFAMPDNVQSVIDNAEKMIFEISENQIQGKAVALKDIIHHSMETIDQLYQKREHVTGVSSGFHLFDAQTAGLQPSDLIIVAGRPSMGKSAFVSALCEHAGIILKKPILFFSLEMSKESLVQRMLCSHARVDAQRVRTGYLSHQDWPKLTSAAGKLSESPIFIDDTPSQSVLEIRAKARRMKMQHDIQMIVVDYLQLIHGVGRIESRQQEISEISRSLKAIARELRVPVVAISQLSRAVESRTGNKPQLSDLRDSGAIEQDADVVVFLFREEYYNPTEENKNKAEVIIAKQRNGPVGSVELAFLKEWTRFENLETRRMEPS